VPLEPRLDTGDRPAQIARYLGRFTTAIEFFEQPTILVLTPRLAHIGSRVDMGGSAFRSIGFALNRTGLPDAVERREQRAHYVGLLIRAVGTKDFPRRRIDAVSEGRQDCDCFGFIHDASLAIKRAATMGRIRSLVETPDMPKKDPIHLNIREDAPQMPLVRLVLARG
jgi:hypothetical protein